MEPLVDVSDYTFPLNLAKHSLWIGAETEVKTSMLRPRLDLSTYEPKMR